MTGKHPGQKQSLLSSQAPKEAWIKGFKIKNAVEHKASSCRDNEKRRGDVVLSFRRGMEGFKRSGWGSSFDDCQPGLSTIPQVSRVKIIKLTLRLPPVNVTLTNRRVYVSLFFARPLLGWVSEDSAIADLCGVAKTYGVFFFSCLSTLGVCDLTFPVEILNISISVFQIAGS